MALKLLTLGGSRDYISKLDSATTEADGASVYILGPLSSRMQGVIQDSAVEAIPDETVGDQGFTARFRGNHASLETVRHGLVGWRNVLDEKGNEVEFKTVERKHGGQTVNIVLESLIQRLPLELVRELAEEIQRSNLMPEEISKN